MVKDSMYITVSGLNLQSKSINYVGEYVAAITARALITGQPLRRAAAKCCARARALTGAQRRPTTALWRRSPKGS